MATEARSILFFCVGAMFRSRSDVEDLVVYCRRTPHMENFAALFVLTYAFLLRMPSEAIPMTAWCGDASLSLKSDTLVLSLARRKNKPRGSRLTRTCWCTESSLTCPVHVAAPLLRARAPGERLFPGLTAAGALKALRWVAIILVCAYSSRMEVCAGRPWGPARVRIPHA